MKIAVIGSRSFRRYDFMKQSLDSLNLGISEIVSGGATGADRLSEKYAKDIDVPTKIFYPQFKQYKHPYHHRNRLIAEYCDKLVAFWDGHSTGTKYTMNYAKRIGKEVIVFKF